MKLTLGKLTLFDTALLKQQTMFDLTGMGASWQVQVEAIVRAPAVITFDRGNAQVNPRFTMSRLFGTYAEALSYVLLAHPVELDAQRGQMIACEIDAFTSPASGKPVPAQTLYLTAGQLLSMTLNRIDGCRLFLDYAMVGGMWTKDLVAATASYPALVKS